MRAAAPATELEALDRDHLDPLLAQAGVRVDVALVGDHHPGLQADDVVAVVPLLAGGLERVAAGGDHAQRVDLERRLDRLHHPAVERLGHRDLGVVAGADRPHAGAVDDVGEERHRVAVDHRQHRVEVHVGA